MFYLERETDEIRQGDKYIFLTSIVKTEYTDDDIPAIDHIDFLFTLDSSPTYSHSLADLVERICHFYMQQHPYFVVIAFDVCSLFTLLIKRKEE